MTPEHPHWAAVELRRIANGWIVQQKGYGDERVYPQLHEVYCFTEWRDCERFMALVTIPTSPNGEAQS